jgi:hypothetical protein
VSSPYIKAAEWVVKGRDSSTPLEWVLCDSVHAKPGGVACAAGRGFRKRLSGVQAVRRSLLPPAEAGWA